MSQKHTNSLISETSPYLLQHAHNPVNWYPWGPEALEKAKNEQKVILVSIGYSACHWCHVMERESFENEATAALMNEHFINIKIDREERPDIDQVYMDAVQAMTGSGGWPLNVFLTPDAKPFYGGTYFPPVKAFNRASWTDVLSGIVQAWEERRDEIETQATHLTEHISKSSNFVLPVAQQADFQTGFGFERCDAMFTALMQAADRQWGGFGKAPKFPQTFSIQFLLQYHHYSGNQTALEHALLSIDKMLEGGIFDHIGGGMSRYSTDTEWLAPHFEKMLYDNALLILLLCDAFQVTRLDKYRKAIYSTIGFAREELLHPDGGFYTAMDADSEGEEGKYYVWEKAEIEALLGTDAPIFCDYFDVTTGGNWEGKNILRILKPAADMAPGYQLTEIELTELITRSLDKLKAARSKRVKPGLDDKIILGLNALMQKAIARSALIFQDMELADIATGNHDFILQNFMGEQGGLMHTWKNGQAKYPAFLDDYANLVDASITLYELTLDTRYLQRAREWCDYTVEHFGDDEELLFFYTGKLQQDIILRKKEVYDGATPSGNSIMAHNLTKLATIFDRDDWRIRANNMVQAIASASEKYPSSFGVWAGLLMQKIKGQDEITVTGENAPAISRAILADQFNPARVLMVSGSTDDQYPMLKNKPSGGPLLIYICKNYICLPPCLNLEEFYTLNGSRKI